MRNMRRCLHLFETVNRHVGAFFSWWNLLTPYSLCSKGNNTSPCSAKYSFFRIFGAWFYVHIDGERIIVHICWQCKFKDKPMMFERADVWTVKHLHVQTSAVAIAIAIMPMFDRSIYRSAFKSLLLMFECCIQTSATLAAKGHQGKSFSGCGGANEYVQSYAPILMWH